MKKNLYILLLVIVVFPPTKTKAENGTEEKESIKKIILSSYVEGLHNKGDLTATEEGFHPGFNLLILKNDRLEKLPIYNWIKSAKARKEKDSTPCKESEKIKCKFLNIDITGTVAVAKIELSKKGKVIYIDYLSLYKFKDDWKIVGKVYYQLPE